MVWLINFLADRFGNRAVLKGGMELRLLGCPRHTNDIDYVFVPFSSKNDVRDLVLPALRETPELRVEHSLSSRCLRCVCTHQTARVQVEINVATECASQELSTATLARANDQQGRIVRGMRLDVALAHKLAAWNERGLVRDLYDCHFMADVLAVRPDMATLKRRLAATELRTGRKTTKVSMEVADLVARLDTALSSLTQPLVEEQMRDFRRPEELPGLEKKIRIGVSKLLSVLGQERP